MSIDYFIEHFHLLDCGMEQRANCRSNESLATSDEYEFVNTSSSKPLPNPQLQTETTASELERTLTEVRDKNQHCIFYTHYQNIRLIKLFTCVYNILTCVFICHALYIFIV